MNIKNHVTSIELSKQLKEAGIPQEGSFYWVNPYMRKCLDHEYTLADEQISLKDYRAFLASELMEILPSHNHLKRIGKTYIVTQQYEPPFHYLEGKTPQDALAKMVLYLVKEKIINFKDKNEKNK